MWPLREVKSYRSDSWEVDTLQAVMDNKPVLRHRDLGIELLAKITRQLS